jgi:hypothetical protein
MQWTTMIVDCLELRRVFERRQFWHLSPNVLWRDVTKLRLGKYHLLFLLFFMFFVFLYRIELMLENALKSMPRHIANGTFEKNEIARIVS